jgi:regulator of PEP synthase PpsR (kinase-PPPase family)
MGRKKSKAPLPIIILSGGKGYTGDAVVRSALAQFDSPAVEVIHKTDVRGEKAALKAVRDAADKRAIICHTLVEPDVRDAVQVEAERLSVPLVDVLGPVLRLLGDHLESRPQNVPGRSYELQRDQFDRFKAVDFTLSHDDGAHLWDLDRADVVLVGVSRSCKSVTCFFLAYRGIRAANVPLIVDQEPPEELTRLDPAKVIALTMNPHRLQKVRDVRASHFADGVLDAYIDSSEISRELRHANALIAKHGWRSLDVSYQGIEEVAKEVLKMLGR